MDVNRTARGRESYAHSHVLRQEKVALRRPYVPTMILLRASLQNDSEQERRDLGERAESDGLVGLLARMTDSGDISRVRLVVSLQKLGRHAPS